MRADPRAGVGPPAAGRAVIRTGRSPARWLLVAAAAAALLWPGFGGAEPPKLWAPPVLDPLRSMSLPLDPSDAILPAEGRWSLQATVGYFNVQKGTWHVPTVHQVFGLEGQPVSREELQFLGQAFSNDDIYHLDLEGWQVAMRASLNLGRSIMLSAQLPWYEVGRPHWDDIASSVHRALGLTDDGFEVIPYGQTVIYAYSGEQRVEQLNTLDGTGWGDLSLALSGPLGHRLGADHRWSVVVEAPTGEDDWLAGSGGWDVGLRWFGSWELDNAVVLAGIGYTFLDDDGSWLGLPRDDVWQLHVAYHQRLSAAWSLRAALRSDSSPFRAFDDSALGEPSLLIDLGVRRELGSRTWLGLSFAEDLPHTGVTVDYTLQLLVGTTLGKPARAGR